MTQELKPGEVAHDLIAHIDVIKRAAPKLSSAEWQIIYENMLTASRLISERERELAEARTIITELADDLEGEMKDRYCLGNGEPHPAMKRKYDRDMVPVVGARAFLASKGQAGESLQNKPAT